MFREKIVMDEEDDIEEFEYEEIKKYTNNKNEEMLITKLQFGSIYRGKKGDRQFTVKIWDNCDSNFSATFKLYEEMDIRRRIKIKGIPRPICDRGSYYKFTAFMVYDLILLDTIHNLIPKDSFTWQQRIKVSLGLASILRYLHEWGRSFILRNVDAATVMCDQDYNPILLDLDMFAGGVYRSREDEKQTGISRAYIDPYVTDDRGPCSTKTDVFGYGVFLLSLITKRVFDGDTEFAHKWAEKEYKHRRMQGQTRPSLVDLTLKASPCYYQTDGRTITELAMQCISYMPGNRPEMEDVARTLENLEVVIDCSDISSVVKMGEP